MNSVSANGYQIVVSTSQATARSDVNVATIQVCHTSLQSIQTEFRAFIVKHDPLAILFGIRSKYFYVVLYKLHKLSAWRCLFIYLFIYLLIYLFIHSFIR
jgi:hypothetical protein